MKTSFYTPIELRTAIVAKLKDAKIENIGEKVYKSRTENGWRSEGAFLCVYTSGSDFDDNRTSPALYSVTTTLNVDVVVAGPVCNKRKELYDLNDLFDEITAKVVAVLLGYPHAKEIAPGVMVDGVTLRSITNTLQGAGEVDKGAQRLVFNVAWTVGLPVNDGDAGNDYRVADTVIQDGDASMNFETNVRG